MTLPPRSTSDWSDEELALACQQLPHQESAWTELWTRYCGKVAITVRWALGPTGAYLADDAVSEVFFTLCDRIGSFSPERGRLSAFIASVARSVAIDFRRRSRNRQAGLSLDTGNITVAPTVEPFFPPELLAKHAVQSLMRATTGERRLILDCLVDGKTVAETAKEVGRSESHVRRVKSQYIAAVRAAIAELSPGNS